MNSEEFSKNIERAFDREARISTLEAELAHINADKRTHANVCLSEENDALIAENKRLREALEGVTELLADIWSSAMEGDAEDEIIVREARAALQSNTAEDGAR